MRIESLTFFRFIAALIVVIYHFGQEATGFSGMLVAGPQMVTFFFVLSGFVMALSYFNKSVFDARSYWWARAARIMPVYLLALILMVLASIKTESDDVSLISFGLNLTLLQAWSSPYPLSINSPGWSLSVEAFFYLIFPFVLLNVRRFSLSSGVVFLSALVLWLLTQIVLSTVFTTHYEGYRTLSHDLIFYFPPSHLCSFLLGIAGGMWVIEDKGKNIKSRYSLFSVLLFSTIIVLVLNNQKEIVEFIGFKVAFGSSFLAPIFLCFIVSVSICRSRLMDFFNSKSLILLGEASYSVYILQIPVHYIFNFITKSKLVVDPLTEFCIYLCFLLVISVLCYRFFEKPTNIFLRNVWSPNRSN